MTPPPAPPGAPPGMPPHGGSGGGPSPAELLASLTAQAAELGFLRRELPRHSLLAGPGLAADFIFAVVSGRVRVYLSDGERELSLAYLDPGEVFSTHTTAYLRCERPSVLLTMETARFGRVLAAHPEFTPGIIRVLGRLLQNCLERIEGLALHDVGTRLARFLSHAAKRRGRPDGNGGVFLNLDLNAGDIALLLGTTRQTVSAQLNQLARAGVLERRGRTGLLIHRPDVLAQQGGPLPEPYARD